METSDFSSSGFKTLQYWIDMQNSGKLTIPEVEVLFELLLIKTNEMHSQGVIHHALKPEHILVDLQSSRLQINGYDLKGKDVTLGAGTPFYASPEQLVDGTAVDEKSDMYTLGIVFLELLCPCKSETERASAIQTMRYSRQVHRQVPENLKKKWPQYAELILRLTSFDPADRPSAAEALTELQKKKKWVRPSVDPRHETINQLKEIVTKLEDDIQKKIDSGFVLENAVQSPAFRLVVTEGSVFDTNPHIGLHTLRHWITLRNRCFLCMNSPIYELRIFELLLEKVEEVHSKKNFHGAIKPECILVDEQNRILKLDCNDLQGEGVSLEEAKLPLYVAPEKLTIGSTVNEKSDIYSLGIIFLELLMLCRTGSERIEMIQGFRRTRQIPEDITSKWPQYAEFILILTSADPAVRPSAAEAIKDLQNKKNYKAPLRDLLDDVILCLDRKISHLQKKNESFRKE